jgi:small subunit ribosomal protein S18
MAVKKKFARKKSSVVRIRKVRLGKDFMFDYKQPGTLVRFLNETFKILPRRNTGLTAKQQRDLVGQVKRARAMALLPYSDQHATKRFDY